MGLFGFGKKKEEKETDNLLDGVTEASVKVLGSGCAKCNELEKNVKSALEQLGMDTAIEHVTDCVTSHFKKVNKTLITTL